MTRIETCEVDVCSGGCPLHPGCGGRLPARGSRERALTEQERHLVEEGRGLVAACGGYKATGELLAVAKKLGVSPGRALAYRTAELAEGRAAPEEGDAQLAILRNEVLRLGKDIAARPGAQRRWGPFLAEVARRIDEIMGAK